MEVKRLHDDLVEREREANGLRTEVCLARDACQTHETSNSWRLTNPRRLARHLPRKIVEAKAFSLAVLRKAYHRLPVPDQTRQRLKGAFYRSFPRLFGELESYKFWQEQKFFARAIRDVTPEEVLTAPSPKLAPADGRWEWDKANVIRSRIANAFRARTSQLHYTPHALIRIEPAAKYAAAASIQLPDPGPAPDVTVVVPVFNQLTTTLECLTSLATTEPGIAFEIIVADDASTDETPQVLSQIPYLVLFRQAQNLGFLRNCNSAAKSARGRRLVFLNNDTQVHPRWLHVLMRAMDEPGTGAVGPRVIYPSGALQEAGVRVCRHGAVEMLGLNDLPDRDRWSYARSVDYVSGACLMVDRSLFEELGGFAADLAPAYCEDLDLCIRIQARGLKIKYAPDSQIYHHLSKSSDSVGANYKHHLIARNMQTLAERHQSVFDSLDDVRVIAFYLPQFHPIPENDLWWGPGFTEWRNVARARPNFVGHDQPAQPTDLGYYDLRLPEVMTNQWALADRYGIDGFCYYYYWFAGHRLLETPLENMLQMSGKVHPFCLCWANENWTRRWDGQDKEILIAQHHSPADDIAVLRDLSRYMRHPAYIRIAGGRPLLLIYRVDLFPDFAATARRWREEARNLGIGDIYIAMVESFKFAGARVPPADYGCDASVEFPAHYAPRISKPSAKILNPDYCGTVASYDEVATYFATREPPGFKRFRTAMPRWDNTARNQNGGFCLTESSPGSFQAWLESIILDTKRDFHGDERMVFVNAWNEWAEGAYLEPDRRFGHSYLEAIRNARQAAHLIRSSNLAP